MSLPAGSRTSTKSSSKSGCLRRSDSISAWHSSRVIGVMVILLLMGTPWSIQVTSPAEKESRPVLLRLCRLRHFRLHFADALLDFIYDPVERLNRIRVIQVNFDLTVLHRTIVA